MPRRYPYPPWRKAGVDSFTGAGPKKAAAVKSSPKAKPGSKSGSKPAAPKAKDAPKRSLVPQLPRKG